MQNENHHITTVINYCSNDYRFIQKCIKEASVFSHQIIVPVCDHFFDGSLENRDLLNLTYLEHPDVEFVEYKFYQDKTYSPYKKYPPESIENRHLWHSTSRYISYFFLKEKTKYVLFIDADEIYEGEKFKKWLDEFEYKKFDALRIGSYIYFNINKQTYRGDLPQIFGLMAKKEALSPDLLLVEGERFATFKYINGLKKHMVLGKNYIPMSHHYSWVRPKQEKIKKVNTWGHFADKNWLTLINNEEKNFKDTNKDPYYEMNLEKSNDIFFDPLNSSINLKKLPNTKTFPNVRKTSYTEIFEKELKLRHNF